MKYLVALILLCYVPSFGYADSSCFMVHDGQTTILQEGDCVTTRSPCSTFKLALSVIGYDSGILLDDVHPTVPFKKGYPDYRDIWKQEHNPRLWLKNCCLWYSQYIAQKLGSKKLKAYLAKLKYGNQDISGDKGENNGLKRSWISSSLEISPENQLRFIVDLKDNTLPCSERAQIMTKKIMTREQLPNGWTLYLQTGSGFQRHPVTHQKTNLKQGWTVGWIEKGEKVFTFVYYVKEDHFRPSYAGPRAKKAALEKLQKLITKMTKT